MDIYQFIFWDQLELIKRLQYVEIKSLLLILRKQKGDSHGYRYYKNFLKGERKEFSMFRTIVAKKIGFPQTSYKGIEHSIWSDRSLNY